MAGLLKMSEATALALHSMVMIAKQDTPLSAAPISEQLCASEAHVFKVLQQLVRAGFLKSKRGPGGGYVLTRRPDEITLIDIYEVFEGPIRRDGCLFERPVCGRTDCALGHVVKDVRHAVMQSFAATTLGQAANN